MRADELIEILRDLPGDANVVVAVVDPVVDGAEEVTLRRFDLDILLPEGDEGESWLVVGEESDLDAFLDVIESAEDASGNGSADTEIVETLVADEVIPPDTATSSDDDEVVGQVVGFEQSER